MSKFLSAMLNKEIAIFYLDRTGNEPECDGVLKDYDDIFIKLLLDNGRYNIILRSEIYMYNLKQE